MKYGILISLLSLSAVLFPSHAQDNYEQQSYFRSFSITSEGLVCTDNYGSAIYLMKDGKTLALYSANGCGNYYTVSPNGKALGLKIINSESKQFPALLDIKTKSVTQLNGPAERCGQPSFACDGTISFTLDNILFIKYPNGNSKQIDLGYYCNLAPLSPDGRFAAFNDADDQLKLASIETGKTIKITDGKQGYFNPIWSSDGSLIAYNSLGGGLYVYDINSTSTYTLGEGFSPRWLQAANSLIFFRKEIKDMRLVNSEIFISDYKGIDIKQISFTSDICEIDPICSGLGLPSGLSGSDIYFGSLKTGKVYKASFNSDSKSLNSYQQITNTKPQIQYYGLGNEKAIKSAMDIPYVNQVYDTPDWFNGHSACGPTSSIMAIGYYNLLPKWDGYCSTPSAHYNSWGRYVSDKYRFRSMYYALTANDPNGKAAYGGFGYMWSSGSPHSKMSYYYNNHGFTSVTSDNPPHSTALNEIGATYPYTICVGLTSAGHIIVMHGLGAEQHTVVTNDPYGDKNKPGYPNNYGKNAMYDWPGYSNGYQNLQTVYWASTTHYTRPAVSDTLVDDLQFQKEFYLHTKAPSSMEYWRDNQLGYKAHYWYCYSRNSSTDTCYAEWRPTLSRDGYYEVFAYLQAPFTNSVKYKIYHKDGTGIVETSQNLAVDNWQSLGKFNFLKGSTGYVRLGDASNKSGDVIAFDAIRWSYLGDLVNVNHESGVTPNSFELLQNYPNPFNPSTTIRFSLPAAGYMELNLYDIIGNKTAVLAAGYMTGGNHEIAFNGEKLNSGVYFYTLKACGHSSTKKMILLK